MRKLVFFDFDKTLMQKDTFFLLSQRAAKSVSLRCYTFFLAVLHKLSVISNSTYKELVLKKLWFSKSKEEQERITKSLIAEIRNYKIQASLSKLEEYLRDADTRVYVLTASLRETVEEIVKDWGYAVEVRGAEYELHDGHLKYHNCYGEQKKKIARKIIEEQNPSSVIAYTDSRSDLPLLSLADSCFLINPTQELVKEAEKLGGKVEVING